MRKKIEFQWERLDVKEEKDIYWNATYRAKVIGGWLVRSFDLTYKTKSTSESMVFVEDKYHEWHVIEPAKESPPAMEKPVSEGY